MKSFSISEFCQRQRIGRTFYYQLEKLGRAPRTFRLGKIRRISEEAERDWVAKLEAETNAAA